jgi:hypothetical protein
MAVTMASSPVPFLVAYLPFWLHGLSSSSFLP